MSPVLSTVTHVQSDTGTEAAIRVRMDKLDLMTRVLGCESDTARAELLNVNARTIARARTSGIVGGVFVAKTLLALGRHGPRLAELNLSPGFDALFEVVEVPTGVAAAAA